MFCSAEVGHKNVSLKIFNNPYAPLGIIWDKTEGKTKKKKKNSTEVLHFLKGKETQTSIILKCSSLAFVDLIYLLADLTFFAQC